MKVRHKETGIPQDISKEDFEILKETGHAQNFEVLSESDEGFTPPEAQVETPPAEKDNNTSPDKKDLKKGDK